MKPNILGTKIYCGTTKWHALQFCIKCSCLLAFLFTVRISKQKLNKIILVDQVKIYSIKDSPSSYLFNASEIPELGFFPNYFAQGCVSFKPYNHYSHGSLQSLKPTCIIEKKNTKKHKKTQKNMQDRMYCKKFFYIW